MTIAIKDANNNTVSIPDVNVNGRALAASSAPIVLSTEDKTALDLLHTDMVAATPTGTNVIGRVGFDQTTPGTTNKVSLASDTVNVNITGGQLGETLWTDDVGAYFVRLDNGGTITFVPPGGGTAVTPGAGLRPAGDAATVDKSSYTVTTAGTGYAVGDLIAHLVAIDRKTGAIITNTWLNSTQATVLGGAPSAANIMAIGTGTQAMSMSDGGSITLGAKNDAANIVSTTSMSAMSAAKGIIQLLAATPSSISTGGNIIGRVGFDQTTPGTTNKVSIGTDGTVVSKLQDGSGVAVTSTAVTVGGVAKQRLDVTLASGIAVGSALPTTPFMDLFGGVDASLVARAFLMDTAGRAFVNVNSLPAITGSVTVANPVTSVIVSSIPAITGTVTVANPVTSVIVSSIPAITGSVGINNYPVTQPVSIAALPALATGGNAIGSITNTAFSLTGSTIKTTAAAAGDSALVVINRDTVNVAATNIFRNETATALGASATFTGTTRDTGVAVGVATGYAYFNASFIADQAGTIFVDGSNDGTTFYVLATSALAISTSLLLSVPVVTRYYRVRVVNGSTAQTLLFVNSSFTGA